MSNPENKALGDLIAGISWILAIVFFGLFTVNYVFNLTEGKNPEYFRKQKFEDAKKNGWATFYNVMDGPIHSTIYVGYDSFTRKFNCTLSNFGSFKFKEGSKNIYMNLKKKDFFILLQDFYNDESKGYFVRYKLDNGAVRNHKAQYKLFPKNNIIYLEFPYYLFKDAKEVSIRYGQKSKNYNIEKTVNFERNTVDSIYYFYQLCSSNKFPEGWSIKY